MNKVYTIKIFKTLYVLANNYFKKLKLINIKSECEDGLNGWKEESPFDKIFISPKLLSCGVQILQLFKVDKNKSLSKIKDICEVNFDSFKTL